MLELTTEIDSSMIFELNKKGFIPGITEQEAIFKARVRILQDRQLTLAILSEEGYSYNISSTLDLKSTLEKLHTTFDIYPEWSTIIYSREGLSYWHAGATWTFSYSMTEQFEIPLPIIQLHSRLLDKKTYFAFYDIQEIIMHELVHIGRMNFVDSPYEEILAYSTSSKMYRRLIGPISYYSQELFLGAGMLIGSQAIISYINLKGIFVYSPLVILLETLAVLLIAYALIATVIYQTRFKKCLHKLQQLFAGKESYIIYRLTKEEITLFAKWSLKKILGHIEQHKENNLRWKIIWRNYMARESLE